MAGLVNVLPSQTAHNFANRKQRNVELLRQLPLTHSLTVQCLDFFYLRLRQFGLTVSRSNMILTALLLNTITLIVERSSKKQMFRVYATRVVAFMAHIKGLVKIAISTLIGKTMRGNTNANTQTKSPVTFGAFATSPKPTSISFINVFRKANFRGNRQRASFHFYGAAMSPHSLVVG